MKITIANYAESVTVALRVDVTTRDILLLQNTWNGGTTLSVLVPMDEAEKPLADLATAIEQWLQDRDYQRNPEKGRLICPAPRAVATARP